MRIDVHYHFGPWPWVSTGEAARRVVAQLDRCGIDYCLLSHVRALVSDAHQGNREAAAVCRTDRRLRAYAYLNPLSERMTEELRECATDPAFVGAKTRPVFHAGLYLDAPQYSPALALLAEWRWPLLVHTERSEDAAAACRVAREWPSLPLILAHSTRQTAEACASCENINFDFARSTADRRLIDLEGMIAAVGAGRILFGSDGPLISPAWTIGVLDSVDLTDDERRAIFYRNALRLFPALRGDLDAQEVPI